MTGNFLTGFLAAVFVEAAHWVPLRWDFDEKAASRAWQFTIIATALTSTLIWLDGSRNTALIRLLAWLPALLLPMQFIQSYGTRDSISLHSLSFFSKQRQARIKRLGIEEEEQRFNFGNVLFIVAILAATVGEKATQFTYLPGVAILTLWSLLALTRKRRGSLLVALSIAVSFAIIGQKALNKAYDYVNMGGRQTQMNSSAFDPEFNKTAIGSLGELKLSKDIIWRITPENLTKIPKLLRTASYETYGGITWKNTLSLEARAASTDFKGLVTYGGNGTDSYYLLQDEFSPRAIRADLPRFKIRGAAAENTPLPLPGDVSSLKGFDLDDIERNTMGTVRVFPKKAVIEGTVLWKGDTQPDSPPDKDSLKIPFLEADVIRRTAEELQLSSKPTLEGKMDTIRSWFYQNFQYSRYLSIPRRRTNDKANTEIGRFLTTTHKGHCEYFATATTLLLREAGIPARYAIGFSLMEKDPKRPEYLIRGIHSHAWCRAWNERTQQWVDFDTTPPGWFGIDDTRTSRTQWLSDSIQRLQEDFYLWRNRPANRVGVTVAMVLAGVLIVSFTTWKIWGSRRRVISRKQMGRQGGTILRTPLHDLETLAEKTLGPRPQGLPFPEWLRGLSFPEPAVLDEAIQLHQRLRFDPAPAEPVMLDRLRELVKRLEKMPVP